MSLNHDFLLLDREAEGEWNMLRVIQDPRTNHLHADLIRYISYSRSMGTLLGDACGTHKLFVKFLF